MSETATAIVEKYGPVVRLDAIADKFLGNNAETARRKAVLHQLPFPAFQLDASRKAPWVVNAADLAAFIDQASASAREAWKRSQL